MTQYTWTGGGDGTTWNDPNNWSTSAQSPAQNSPGAGDDVEIGSNASITDSGTAETITIDASLDLNGGSITATDYITDNGDLTVEGDGSSLTTSGGGISVGDAGGSGTLSIEDGATATVAGAGALDIADSDGSTGDVDVTGSGSTLMTAGPVYVGDAGTGSLTIEDSATFTSSYASGPSVDIGLNTTGNGTMTVTDAGTDLDLEQGDGIVVGDTGTGLLQVENGATVTVASAEPDVFDAATLGNNIGGDGTLTVNGAGSTFTAGDGGMSVGFSSSSSVIVSDNATLDVTDATYGLDIATLDGATGDVDITGSGSTS